jgi:hypothetical protein
LTQAGWALALMAVVFFALMASALT